MEGAIGLTRPLFFVEVFALLRALLAPMFLPADFFVEALAFTSAFFAEGLDLPTTVFLPLAFVFCFLLLLFFVFFMCEVYHQLVRCAERPYGLNWCAR